MTKRNCPNCGSTLAPMELSIACTRCVRQALSATHSGTALAAGDAQLLTSIDSFFMLMKERRDGWLRVVPSVSGDFSFKYRFTNGIHDGRYVFCVVPEVRSPLIGFNILERILDDVDCGSRTPSPDKWHG